MQLSKFLATENLTHLYRYAIVGFSGVAIDALTYTVLLFLSFPIAVSKGMSILLSIIFGYFFNAKWTFETTLSKQTLIKYCILYTISIIANLLVNSWVIDILMDIPYHLAIAFFCATCVSIVITFTGLKLWVFKK